MELPDARPLQLDFTILQQAQEKDRLKTHEDRKELDSAVIFLDRVEVMKPISLFAVATTPLFAANGVDSFFMPAGNLVGGASSASRLSQQPVSSSSSTVGRAAAHGAGCPCISCSPATHGRSCSCRSCASGGISARCHGGRGCRCGACSGVRMQAHLSGCGCVDCSPPRTAAFHGASCGCTACASQTHGGSCSCALCASPPSTRGAWSLTVMSMMGAGAATAAAAGGHVSETAAFHGAKCECCACAGVSSAGPHGACCSCGACASRPGGRGASSLTVMGAAAAGGGEQVAGLRQRLSEEPESVMFEETMAAIEDGFDYTPKR